MNTEPYQPGGQTPEERREELLTAYLLDELDPKTRATLEADLAIDEDLAKRKEELQRALAFVTGAFPEEKLSDAAVANVLDAARLAAGESRGWRVLPPSVVRVAAGLALLISGAFVAQAYFGKSSTEMDRMGDYARVDNTPRLNKAPRDIDFDGMLLDEEVEYESEVFEITVADEPASVEAAPKALEVKGGLNSRTKHLDRSQNHVVLERLASTAAPEATRREQRERGLSSASRVPVAKDVQVRLSKSQPANQTPFDGRVFNDAIGIGGGGGGPVTQATPHGGGYRGPGDTSPPTTLASDSAVFSLGQPVQKPQEVAKVGQPGAESFYLGAGVKTVAPAREVPPVGNTITPAPDPAATPGLAHLGYHGGSLSASDKEKVEKLGRMRAGLEVRFEAQGLAELRDQLGQEVAAGRGLAFGVNDLALLDELKGSFDLQAFTPESFEAFVQQHFDRCCLAPNESPRDMFFRYWGEHPFTSSREDVLSTFAADADTASYTLARRYLAGGQLPDPAGIRTEEFVNYFRPDAPAPYGDTFGVHFELAPSTFHADPNAWMLRVTVRGKDIAKFERKPLALTFVIDVSGSMKEENRMGLVKEALGLLTTELQPNDSVAIVKFNNSAERILPMVTAQNRAALEDAIVPLTPGGGTNVQGGLTEGFKVASSSLVPGAINRVVFLSDGVGNIGETDQKKILDEVSSMRERGIYLNTIGVGMGNHNDAFLEQLANQGDGVANYIDSSREAEKVMVYDFTKTFQPIARDVKIQVEFDPSQVSEWRQLGYENRAVADSQFRNDAVDAGELNAGHQVTALYEVIRTPRAASKPLATCRLRWKEPFAVDNGDVTMAGAQWAEKATERTWSTSGREAVYDVNGASFGMRRAMVAAQFAELLKRSKHARGDRMDYLAGLVSGLVKEQPRDLEVKELANMISLARPMLEALQAQSSPVDELMDRLAEKAYLEGRIQKLEESEDRTQQSIELVREIEGLKDELRKLLADRVGFDLSAVVNPGQVDTFGQER